MKKAVFFSLTAAVAATLFLGAAKASNGSMQGVGVVDFRSCIEQSKFGKQEQSSYEAMQNQMLGQMEATQKELQEIIGKLQDREYLDGISPEAEQQLQMKGQQLTQTLEAQRQQFQAILQQAQMKMVQMLNSQVSQAAESVAKAKGLNLVLQEDAVFYADPSFEITDAVVEQMDTQFDKESTEDGQSS